MFCTTECWSCEDKTCEHYISKTELYAENKRLKKVDEEHKELNGKLRMETRELRARMDEASNLLRTLKGSGRWSPLMKEIDYLLDLLEGNNDA